MAKDKIYFGEDTEAIILQYICEKNPDVKNSIFNTRIYPKLLELVKKLVFNSNMQLYCDNVDSFILDAVIHVYEQCLASIDNDLKKSGYDPNKGKAFSYITRTVQNYICQAKGKYINETRKRVGLETLDSEKMVMMEYSQELTQDHLSSFVDAFVDFYRNIISHRFKKKSQLIALAFIEIMSTRGFLNTFNKKMLYVMIREIVNSYPKIMLGRSNFKLKSIDIKLVLNQIRSDFYFLYKMYDGENIQMSREDFLDMSANKM